MNQLPKEPKLQFIRLDRGISQFNHDYYAALGLPIVNDVNYIRQVYLDIARILHPDIYGFSIEEKQVATQYLAKLVNPAYNALMDDRERNAYQAIFKLLAKRLMQKSRNIQIHSTAACELMFCPNDGLYERSIAAIANVQYQSLENILEYTGQISELNLVYILYKEGYLYGASNMPPVLTPMVLPKKYSVSKGYPNPPERNSYSLITPNQYYSNYSTPNNLQADADETVIQYRIEESDASGISDRLKICEIYLSQANWKVALKELREILQLDQNNSKCLAMLGVVYKNINQFQMAKISFQRSLQINPQEPLALKHIKDLNNPNAQTTKSSQSANNSKLEPIVNKNKALPSPQKRGWLYNLLGWASKDTHK